MGLNVFFDVDYTIQADDGTLRPGVRDVFERLLADGHVVFVWSAVGERWDDLRRHGLLDLVAGVHRKPIFEHHERLALLGVAVTPDVVVDDSPDIVDAFGGVCVKAYTPDGSVVDAEMERVYLAITTGSFDAPRPAADPTPLIRW